MNKLWVMCTAGVLACVTANAQNNTSNTDETRAFVTSQSLFRDTTPLLQVQPSDNTAKKQPVYKLKPAVDIPLTAIGTGWTLYAFSQIYSKDESSGEKILSLDKKNVPGFDRWAIRPFHDNADKISYYPFYAAMPMPVFFLLDNKMRKDFWKLSLLYLEAMSVTGILYTGATYTNDRYRPYAYDERTDFDYRRRGGAKNSFYAGHPALVATATFFFAQVYADYHPESKIKWLFYTGAGALTAFTGYTRHYAGQHFPSDLLLGVTQGTLAGLLVPRFHRTKLFKQHNISLRPFATGQSNGMAVIYKFK